MLVIPVDKGKILNTRGFSYFLSFLLILTEETIA